VRARLRDERGIALPIALALLSIIALFTASALTFATHSTDRATRDRLVVRANAAADAGLDAALYRMNKALVASQVTGTFGLPVATLAEVKCLNLSVDLVVSTLDASNGWCQATPVEEDVDGAGSAGANWVEASFSYQVSTGVKVAITGGSQITREIVSTGYAGDIHDRVMLIVVARLNSSNGLTSVFEPLSYQPCSADPPVASDPSSGC
jgi:Tfp pilus assembly protein PilX